MVKLRSKQELSVVSKTLKDKLATEDFNLPVNSPVSDAYRIIVKAIEGNITNFNSPKLCLPELLQTRAIVSLYYDWLRYLTDYPSFLNIKVIHKSNEDIQS